MDSIKNTGMCQKSKIYQFAIIKCCDNFLKNMTAQEIMSSSNWQMLKAHTELSISSFPFSIFNNKPTISPAKKNL